MYSWRRKEGYDYIDSVMRMEPNGEQEMCSDFERLYRRLLRAMKLHRQKHTTVSDIYDVVSISVAWRRWWGFNSHRYSV